MDDMIVSFCQSDTRGHAQASTEVSMTVVVLCLLLTLGATRTTGLGIIHLLQPLWGSYSLTAGFWYAGYTQ